MTCFMQPVSQVSSVGVSSVVMRLPVLSVVQKTKSTSDWKSDLSLLSRENKSLLSGHNSGVV